LDPPGTGVKQTPYESRIRIEAIPAMQRSLRCLLLLVGLGFGWPMGPVGAAESPSPEAARAPVVELQNALLEGMRAGASWDFATRRARFETVVRRTHHLDVMVGFVLGRHARELSEGDRQRLQERLGALTAAHYAARFDRHQGERFERLGVRPYGRARQVVATRLIRPADEPVTLDYVVERHAGEVGIVNVLANGVSEVAMRRVEFTQRMAEGGVSGLLQHIEEAIAELSES
jgi:phospholipid transport system substrate-binding protein